MAGSAPSARADAADHCCICLDSLDAEGLGRQCLPCGHVMHENCVAELRRRGASGRCPLCRQSHEDLVLLGTGAQAEMVSSQLREVSFSAENLSSQELPREQILRQLCRY